METVNVFCSAIHSIGKLLQLWKSLYLKIQNVTTHGRICSMNSDNLKRAEIPGRSTVQYSTVLYSTVQYSKIDLHQLMLGRSERRLWSITGKVRNSKTKVYKWQWY